MGWCNHKLVKEDILICRFYMLLGSVERRCFLFVQCWHVRAGASVQSILCDVPCFEDTEHENVPWSAFYCARWRGFGATERENPL